MKAQVPAPAGLPGIEKGIVRYGETAVCVPRQYLPQSHGRIYHEKSGGTGGTGGPIPNCLRRHQHGRAGKSRLSPARQKLAEHGISCAGKTSRQLRREDYAAWDLLLGMDRANLRNMNRICGGDPAGKIHLLMEYAGHSGEVADPWYTGDFDTAYRDILAGCQGLLSSLRKTGGAF